MADLTALGHFLRARRDLVTPALVGITEDDARRRVPGLRREELALLAGISLDYYVRLERGRDRHPSALVLDALARALQLDPDAAAHLHALAAHPVPGRPRRARRAERVRPAVARTVAGLNEQPAFVHGRLTDVLEANPLAKRLLPGFTPGVNLMRFVFLDPRAREGYGDWDAIARDAVAGLRAAAGTDLDDPALTALVGELSLKSEAFGRLWARHDVRDKSAGTKRFRHPQVGELALDYETFPVAASPGQVLVVYSAAPGSEGERSLRLLRTAP